MLRLILLDFIRKREEKQPLDEVISWVKANLHQQIRIEDMAEVAGLSGSHFRRLFRKRFNISAIKYVRKLKVEAACRMLVRTRDPIKRISLHLGFDEVPHFHRTFKSVTGMTPSQYRKKMAPIG